jgi:hypothetical protein
LEDYTGLPTIVIGKLESLDSRLFELSYWCVGWQGSQHDYIRLFHCSKTSRKYPAVVEGAVAREYSNVLFGVPSNAEVGGACNQGVVHQPVPETVFAA